MVEGWCFYEDDDSNHPFTVGFHLMHSFARSEMWLILIHALGFCRYTFSLIHYSFLTHSSLFSLNHSAASVRICPLRAGYEVSRTLRHTNNARMCFSMYDCNTWLGFVYLARILCISHYDVICIFLYSPLYVGIICRDVEGIERGYIYLIRSGISVQ